jgi:hypothetical protein
MGDTVIITDDDKPAPPPTVIVVEKDAKPQVEKVVTEKTTVIESHNE